MDRHFVARTLRSDGKRTDVVNWFLMLLGLSSAPELEQVLSLDLERATLNRRGAAQPPQQACQSKNKFSFDRGAAIGLDLPEGGSFGLLAKVRLCFAILSSADGAGFIAKGPSVEFSVGPQVTVIGGISGRDRMCLVPEGCGRA
jgi:hypothetical protein